MTDNKASHVVAVARGLEHTDEVGPQRGPHQEALQPWVGHWINNGYTINDDGSRGATITTSDVYQWAIGGFFVVHTAYGRIGDTDGGGIEIIGYDEAGGDYVSHFYDSLGNMSTSKLVCYGDDTWTYQGDTTRATVKFSDSDRVQTVVHERTDDGQAYVTSMNVTLHKVE